VLAAVASIPRAVETGSAAHAASASVAHTPIRTTEFMASKITAPRGTQDLIPPQSARWQDVEARIRELAHRFGYGEIRTPLFESTDLFVRGVGETTDIVEKEMYTFPDKSERSMTLRPEWTAPVVRAALEHNLFAQGPLRVYYVGPIFRYERPQRGRYRQSHQFGVECFGYAGPEADFEVISLAWELVRSYGIDDAVLNVNSIGDDACRPLFRESLLAHFRPHAAQLSPESQRRLERNPLRVLDSKDERDLALVATAPTIASVLCEDCRAHFSAVTGFLEAAGIPFVLNPQIVRGLDYYTRTVFEITSGALGAQSTVCGGGRYDGLVRSLGGPDVPAVGFALGIERLLMMLDALAREGERPRSGIQAVALGARARATLVPIVAELRRTLAIPTFVDFDERKLLAHLKTADRNGARYALILGDDELTAKTMVLRDLAERSDRSIPLGTGKDVAASLVEMGV
jgi:histidyl-tRNA synthetase